MDVADAAGGLAAAEGESAARAWWRRMPLLLTRPRAVFRALRATEQRDVDARAEPLLAIVIVGGMAGIVLTPTWGTLLDQETVDGLVVAVVTFIAGLIYGAAGYFFVGLAVWLGAKGMGSREPYRLARQVVGFSALPFALSLLVTLPLALAAFGGDWFRSGGSDEGAGRWLIVAIGLTAAGWSGCLLTLGLRTTLRLPWRGVAGALALAAVLLAALAVLPSVL